MGRILAIDYGLKRIGMAITDPLKIIASPLQTVQAHAQSKETVKRIVDVIFQHDDIELIIVGLPLHLSGKMSFLADEVKHFIALLEQEIKIPIKPWDERLSTLQAERALQESQMSRKKRAQLIDEVSASVILQSYIANNSFMLETN